MMFMGLSVIDFVTFREDFLSSLRSDGDSVLAGYPSRGCDK